MTPLVSFGGGVNSTAMTLLIMEDPRFAALRPGLRLLFADTGSEIPETYAWVWHFAGWIRDRYGLTLEVVRNPESLEDKCLRQRIIPSRNLRWCTWHHKQKVLYQAARRFPQPVLWLIGIDDGESGRAHKGRWSASRQKSSLVRFPLIEAHMDREACMRFMQTHGLPVPRKSGCFFCPFAPLAHWTWLAREHPDLFARACQLEEQGQGFHRGFTLRHKPLRLLVDKTQRRQVEQNDLFCGSCTGTLPEAR